MLIYLAEIDDPRDGRKFEKIYRCYCGLMYHIAYRILQNQQDAEDAVHNAFLTIAKNIEKISDPPCPKTKSYVVTIVESRAIDLYRRKKRQSDIPLEELPDIATDAPKPRNLAGCILRLPPRYRQVILLKYAQGYSCAEIAKQLKLTKSNVEKIDQRAKKMLLELCKEEEIL